MPSDPLVLLDRIDAALVGFDEIRGYPGSPFGLLLALAEARAKACRNALMLAEGYDLDAEHEVRTWAKAWGLDG